MLDFSVKKNTSLHLLMRLNRLYMLTFEPGSIERGLNSLQHVRCHAMLTTSFRKHGAKFRNSPESLKEICIFSTNLSSQESEEYPISPGLFLPFLSPPSTSSAPHSPFSPRLPSRLPTRSLGPSISPVGYAIGQAWEPQTATSHRNEF